MNAKALVCLAAASALFAGCAAQKASMTTAPAPSSSSSAAAAPAAPSAPADGSTRTVKSRDGRFEGEVVGVIAPGSKFSKVQIGMEMDEVNRLIGVGNGMTSNETGKRWIPFYYGNDTRRIQVSYANEGCLTFTGGNRFGGGGNELIRITADPRGVCGE